MKNFITTWLELFNNKNISNSRKGKFFAAFFKQRVDERNEDVESAIKIAAKATKLNLHQAFELFDEVANRRWHGLRTVRDGQARAFFKMNAEALAQITENMLNNEKEKTA